MKFIMTLVGLLLIGLFIASVLLFTQFEGLARKGLTRYAGKILQCDVHLEGIRLGWSEQAIMLNGVTLLNPEGFTDRDAVRIGTLVIKPEPLTLFSRNPGVTQIVLRDTELHVQYRLGEGTNLGALMANAQTWSERQDADEVPVWGRRLKVHVIDAEATSAKLESLTPPTPPIPLKLPPFSVEDPGGDGAVSGARVMQLILRGLLRQLRNVDTVAPTLRELLEAGMPGEA